jgi:Surface antigen
MTGTRKATFLAACMVIITPAAARSAIDRIVTGTKDVSGSAPARFAASTGVLQCVPFARQLSGIQIYGDAHTWWNQAKGKYARGHVPRVGAVLALRPFANSALGHVASVSRIVDTRTILISHANWSSPGKIERNVTALDVSPENDWSEVRIWYGPNQSLGTTHWPVAGFIYNAKPGTITDLGSERLDQISSDAGVRPAPGKGRHHRDPIGEIIAGSY